MPLRMSMELGIDFTLSINTVVLSVDYMADSTTVFSYSYAIQLVEGETDRSRSPKNYTEVTKG